MRNSRHTAAKTTPPRQDEVLHQGSNFHSTTHGDLLNDKRYRTQHSPGAANPISSVVSLKVFRNSGAGWPLPLSHIKGQSRIDIASGRMQIRWPTGRYVFEKANLVRPNIDRILTLRHDVV